MLVLAATPRLLALRLHRAAGRRFRFVPAESWHEVLETIRSQAVELAVVDPALEGRARSQEIERLRVLFPSLPILLYTCLVPEIVPVLLKLGQHGIRTVLLADHDDAPRRISDLLVEEAASGLSHLLLGDLQDLLAEWPGELRWAIETVVREPERFHTVADLAKRARMDRRTCVRWFAKANLPPPSTVLTAIRMVYAHRLLQDPGYTVEDVARKLGYARVRSFGMHVKEIFGMPPGDLRVTLSPAAAVELVRTRFFRRAPLRLVLAS